MLVAIAPVVYESNPPQFEVKDDAGATRLMKADDVWSRLVEQDFAGGEWSLRLLRTIMPKSADPSALRAFIHRQGTNPDSLAIGPLGPAERQKGTVFGSKTQLLHHTTGRRRLFTVAAGEIFPTPGRDEIRLVHSVRCTDTVPCASLVVDGVSVVPLDFSDGFDKCEAQYSFLASGNTVRIESATRSALFTVEVFDEIIPTRNLAAARITRAYAYTTGLNVIDFSEGQCVTTLWVRRTDQGPPDPEAVVHIDGKAIGKLASFRYEGLTNWLRRDLLVGPAPSLCKRIAVQGLQTYSLRCQRLSFISHSGITV